MGVRALLFSVAFGALLAGCGGGGSTTGPLFASPVIEFEQNGESWSGTPVQNDLADVSNNGFGYTGEIDLYELVVPADGRLQVSLSWDHESDFDLIIAADPFGQERLIEGLLAGGEPEYVGIDVVAGQRIYILVAGWEGDPGEYTLETMLIGPDVPVFDLIDTTDFTAAVASNHPIRFGFSQELEPDQDFASKLAFVTTGFSAQGQWCADGSDLVFYPRLPQAPGDAGGLRADRRYTLQFAAAAKGVRAASGEYLTELYSIQFDVAGLVDEDPLQPPAVLDIDHPDGLAWDGQPITVFLDAALDPNRLGMHLQHLHPDGREITLPMFFTLEQEFDCTGRLQVRLIVEPDGPLPPQSIVRLSIPGWVSGISGSPDATNQVGFGAGWATSMQTR